MLTCDTYETLLMRCFDHDLTEHERQEMDHHLQSCARCRLLFNDLSVILDTLESLPAAEPPAGLERSVVDRVMALPLSPNPAESRLGKIIHGSLAGAAVALMWVVGLAVQGSGYGDLLSAGKRHLDSLAGIVLDLQIGYQILASIFSSEILSLIFTIRFAFILALLGLVIMAVRYAFGPERGGNFDVS